MPVTGINELLAKLKEVKGTLISIKPDVVNEMDNVVLAAKQKCPIDTSKLQNSIEVRDRSTNDEIKVDMGIFADSTINYAVYVEYGTGIYAENGMGRKTTWVYPAVTDEGLQFFRTVGMHPQPFIRPAWDEEKENVVDGVKQAVIKQLQRL